MSASEQSWSFLHLHDPQPGERVITDKQIVEALMLLKDYAATDICNCVVREGKASAEPCRQCQARAIVRSVARGH